MKIKLIQQIEIDIHDQNFKITLAEATKLYEELGILISTMEVPNTRIKYVPEYPHNYPLKYVGNEDYV